jgi:hypothetical protein
MPLNNNMGLRLVFENAKQLVSQLGYDTSQAVVTQSFLRSEFLLSTTTANYNVPITINDTRNGAPTVREQRLNLQDLFVVSAIGIFTTVGASTASNTASLSYNDLRTFVTTTSNTDLLSLYNGKLSIVANNQQILPAWDIQKHYFAPQQQGGILPFTGATVLPVNQLNASEDFMFACEPNIVLNGAANYQATISLPVAPAAVTANTYVCVKWSGLLLQNCTSVK